MTRLFNSPGSIVTDAIDGLLARAGATPLARLDGFPHTKVVVRAHLDRSKVAVVSGGGAGHEPAHIGFIGEGMLAGAVSGEVFASPSVDAVLACLLEVTGDAGCLLIVKNYTGDRLNFGLAAERAKNMGLDVETVICADDIAIADAPQPRGIAGTLFVHKVAGYYAERGHDLATVKAMAEQTARAVRSIGLALAPCDLPGQPARSRDHGAELGLGIHGEPGAERIHLEGARQAVDILVERLMAAGLHGDDPLAVLVNNLGSVTPLEMSVITRDLLGSALGQRVKLLCGPAAYMTSLNMYGFSLSALPLTAELEQALVAPVAPVAWIPAARVGEPEMRALKPGLTEWQFTGSRDTAADRVLRGVCGALVDAQAELNELDSKVGDGDTGTTCANAARAVLSSLDDNALPLADRGQLLLALGQILGNTMGGSSGVLMSIFFTTAGQAAVSDAPLPDALMRGAEAIQRYGGAERGARTLLDALLPALEALSRHGSSAEIADAASAGAASTRDMASAKAGRSSYLREDSLIGVADPGAMAVAKAFQALTLPTPPPPAPPRRSPAGRSARRAPR